MVEEEMMVL